MKSAPLSLYSIGLTQGIVFENSETSNELVFVDDFYTDQKLMKIGKVSLLDYFKHMSTKGYTIQ